MLTFSLFHGVFMKKNMLVAALMCGFSLSAHAGFFDSSEPKAEPEVAPFQCGRDDAVSAMVNLIKDETNSRIAIVYNNDKFVSKVDSYIERVNKTPIVAKNVSTDSTFGKDLNCVATISIGLPAEFMELSTKAPETFKNYIRLNGGGYKDGSLFWKDVTYRVRLSDNQKEVSARGNFKDQTESMLRVLEMINNKEAIIKNNSPERLQKARQDYEIADKKLNEIWKAIPASFRESMKEAQIEWVREKTDNCGTIHAANSDENTIAERSDIFICQEQYTKERIKFLRGDKK